MPAVMSLADQDLPTRLSSKVERTCQQCGNFFFVKPSDIKYGRGKFCSIQCRGKAKRTKLELTCRVCGAQFISYPKAKFCSNRCRFAYYKTTKVERICLQCGKPFIYYLSKGKGKGIFCSVKCQYEFRIGRPLPQETKHKLSKIATSRLADPTKNPMYGKHHSLETKSKLSKAQTDNWRSLEYVAMMMKQMSVRPTIPEKKLEDILNRHFPREYKYTGDGKLLIYGMRPDFTNCNGKKELIELFGDYWHSPKLVKDHWEQTELGKIMAYNSLGYRCLVIWERELEELTEEEIVNKIRCFQKEKKGNRIA